MRLFIGQDRAGNITISDDDPNDIAYDWVRITEMVINDIGHKRDIYINIGTHMFSIWGEDGSLSIGPAKEYHG